LQILAGRLIVKQGDNPRFKTYQEKLIMAYVKLYNKTGDEKAVKIQQGLEKKMGMLPEVFQAMAEQRQLLAELLGPTNPPSAEPPRFTPRPHSERARAWRAC
jgi:hypothetical protein